MYAKVFEVLGQVAGIGGLSLGVLFFLFRDFIRRIVFRKLSDEHAFHLIRTFLYLTFGIALVGIIAWVSLSIAQQPRPGEPKETLITDPQIGPRQLPIKMTNPMPNISGDAYIVELRNRGSLTLDNTILILGPIGGHVSVLIACHTLRLQNGARIVTNGNALILQTAKMVFSGNSGIISFIKADEKSTSGGLGSPGFPGEHGGRVQIATLSAFEGFVKITLSGQSGGDGGPGLQGDTGSAGSRGADAVKGFLDCRSGGQDGGQGGPGGPGRKGGDGGRGGDGGQLLLSGNLVSARSSIAFDAPAGFGGSGGAGGAGGLGGPGGQGGSGDGPCSGGHAGSQGPAGPSGEVGNPGQAGRVGFIANIS